MTLRWPPKTEPALKRTSRPARLGQEKPLTFALLSWRDTALDLPKQDQ
jgi:hypothetical protein